MSALETDLLRAWLRFEPGACAEALPRLSADDERDLLAALDDKELQRLIEHAPVWWLATTITEHPQVPWHDAIDSAGAHPNVVHTLRVIKANVRSDLLSRVAPRRRARIQRALALPSDRIWSVLDEHVQVCHPAETVAAVIARVRTMSESSDDPWVYVTNADDRYLGQVSILSLVEADPTARVGDVPLTDRPRITATLLLADALRGANWQTHDSLPAADDQGRFAGVVRLGTVARALGLDEKAANARPVGLLSALLGLWTELLVATVSRSRNAPS